MHPGNIFVGHDGRYMAVDFGIMGTLNPIDQRYLAENFLAFFNRDYRRVAELHVESEWVPDGTRVDEFESAIRTVCEPIFEKPLKEISFGNVLLRLFQTARRFNMEVQPQLVLLQKTLLNIEGLGRQLYPELDLWKTAKPFLERTMSEQLGARALLRNIRDNVPAWSSAMPELPDARPPRAGAGQYGEAAAGMAFRGTPAPAPRGATCQPANDRHHNRQQPAAVRCGDLRAGWLCAGHGAGCTAADLAGRRRPAWCC